MSTRSPLVDDPDAEDDVGGAALCPVAAVDGMDVVSFGRRAARGGENSAHSLEDGDLYVDAGFLRRDAGLGGAIAVCIFRLGGVGDYLRSLDAERPDAYQPDPLSHYSQYLIFPVQLGFSSSWC
mgnify:CR=1 FL=1